MFINILEEEFEGIIDEAFEEGYAQAYSELQAKTERERALQEKAWDEGYDQAIDDLIEAGVIGESDEEYYSEYEFDDEEEYCFLEGLDEILNGGLTSSNNFDGDKKDISSLEEYNQGYEDGKSRGITLGYNKRDYEYSKPSNSDEECYSGYEFADEEGIKEEYCFFKELERVLDSGLASNIKSDKGKKEGAWKEGSAKGSNFKVEENGDISGFRVTAEKDGASMGNRYDENGKLCGIFINTGNEKVGGITANTKEDLVNNPSHYNSDPSGVKCIEITRHRNNNIGNVIKYVWRNGLKDGNSDIQDLEKAAWYLNDEIQRLKDVE